MIDWLFLPYCNIQDILKLTMTFATNCTSINIFICPLVFVKFKTKDFKCLLKDFEMWEDKLLLKFFPNIVLLPLTHA